MTAVMSSKVAENALCWWEGRSQRSRRANPATGRDSAESAEFAIFTIKGRFYTQSFRCPDTPNGSRDACHPERSEKFASRNFARRRRILPQAFRFRSGDFVPPTLSLQQAVSSKGSFDFATASQSEAVAPLRMTGSYSALLPS